MTPISTAILSFGMSGQVFHAPFLHAHPGFRFHSVWERSKNLAAEKYPDVKTVRTLEEVLSDPEVELVIVNTPNATHYEYAKQALEAGKHVVVEKPFVVTAAEGEELIAIARERNLLLSVYHNRRFDSDFTIVRRVLNEGLLGEVVEAEFHFDRYKEALSPKMHKETPGPGTGALYDLGAHLIDQALQLFGRPQQVFADIRTLRPQSQVDDYFEVLLYYPKLRVRLHCSYLVRKALPAYQLHGYRGSFIKTKSDVQETALIEGRTPDAPDWGAEPESEQGWLHTELDGTVVERRLPSAPGNYMAYFDDVYTSLREGANRAVSAEDGLDVVRVIEAAFRSRREGRVVTFA